MLPWYFESSCIYGYYKFSHNRSHNWRANSWIQIARDLINLDEIYIYRYYLFIDTCGLNIYKFKRQNYHGDLRWKCCGCCYHLTDFEPFPLNHWRSVLNELWCTIHLLASVQEQIWCRNRILPDYYLCICYICYLCVWACVYTCILLLFMHILTDILLTEGWSSNIFQCLEATQQRIVWQP